mgnify:CR=1 FL=1
MLTPQRPSLHQTVQQHAATALALIVGAQFAPLATASFTPDPELDEFPADTTSGSITATMKPGVACIAGKPYVFRKKAAANSYTIAFSGSETYEGASTIVLSDDDAVAAIMWDPVSAEWVRASAAGVAPLAEWLKQAAELKVRLCCCEHRCITGCGGLENACCNRLRHGDKNRCG